MVSVAMSIYDELQAETVFTYEIFYLFVICARVYQAGNFGGRVGQQVGIYGKRSYDKSL